jgi:flagellin-specific chaperone FliS
MIQKDLQQAQDIWTSINSFGALVATPGISQDNVTRANTQISKMLDLLEPLYQKFSAETAGIITSPVKNM